MNPMPLLAVGAAGPAAMNRRSVGDNETCLDRKLYDELMNIVVGLIKFVNQ